MTEPTTSDPPLLGDVLAAIPKPPPILYHYTDAAGLLGILRTQRIWACDALHMNDSKEMTYAVDMIAELASEKSVDGLSEQTAHQIRELRAGEGPVFFHPFIACFSELPDALSQWRAYANNGLGYAVGIRADAIFADPEMPPEANAKTELLRVVYDRAQQENMVRDWLGHVIADEAMSTHTTLGDIAPILKNPGFLEEREWRLLVRFFPPGGYASLLRFRPSRFGLSPYIELAAFEGGFETPSRLPIVHIVEGPRVERPRIAGSMLGYLLKGLGYWPVDSLNEALNPHPMYRESTCVFVSQSTVSYR